MSANEEANGARRGHQLTCQHDHGCVVICAANTALGLSDNIMFDLNKQHILGVARDRQVGSWAQGGRC